MRYLVALVLLVGLVGCQEKGPTAAEKAAIYSAAKDELEEVQKKIESTKNSMKLLRSTGQEPSPQMLKDYYEVLDLFDKEVERIEAIMKENRPSMN